MSSGPKGPMGPNRVTGNKGGARTGAGRKPSGVNSPKFTAELLDALERKAQETGRTLADEVVDLAYSDDKRTQMPAMKLIYDKLIAPTTRLVQEEGPKAPYIYEEGEAEFPSGHAVYLPKEKPDPAKVVSLTPGTPAGGLSSASSRKSGPGCMG